MSNFFTVTLTDQQIENLSERSTIDGILSQIEYQIDQMEIPEKEIGNLYADLMEVHEDDKDRRFKSWAKRISSVDRSKVNGYAFDGEFIPDQDIEYELRPALFLAMLGVGSAKYNYSYYQIIYMDNNGDLYPTEITSNTEKDHSWALRIRDQTADMLQNLQLVTVDDSSGYAAVNEDLKHGIMKR